MAVLTIRNLDDGLKRDLRRQAAENDRSMEEEARVILRRGLRARGRPAVGLGTEIRRLVDQLGGGAELDLLPDEPYEPRPIE